MLFPTDEKVDPEVVGVGKSQTISQGKKDMEKKVFQLSLKVSSLLGLTKICLLQRVLSCSASCSEPFALGLVSEWTARSALKCGVNFVLSRSNKLQLVVVQGHKGSTSGCLPTG